MYFIIARLIQASSPLESYMMSFGSSLSLDTISTVISRKSCFQLHDVTFIIISFLICPLFNQMPIKLWNWLKSNLKSNKGTCTTGIQ